MVRVHTERSDGETFGYGLLIQQDDHTFIAVGHNFTLDLNPLDGQSVAILQADELEIIDGELSAQRRLNGDETFAGTRVRVANTPARMHGFMLTTGTVSGVVRFSLFSRRKSRFPDIVMETPERIGA